jgi:hypothetical protein
VSAGFSATDGATCVVSRELQVHSPCIFMGLPSALAKLRWKLRGLKRFWCEIGGEQRALLLHPGIFPPLTSCVRGGRIGRMKARITALPFFLAVCCMSVCTQTAQKANPVREHNSGPLAWVSSDNNPKTVYWIQGRFVPVDDNNHQGVAEVATILCSIRENECLEIDSTSPLVNGEQVWIQEFKPVSWDSSQILATSRSPDGCTDETLKIRFSPPSVILINSPVLPMSDHCKKLNGDLDKLMGKSGGTIAAQMEQDELVPTRGLLSFQDVNIKSSNGTSQQPAANNRR